MRQTRATIRSFTWADLGALASLLQLLEQADHEPTADVAEQTRRQYRQPGLHPERDCFLAWDGQEVVGYLFMGAEEPIGRGVIAGGVHPSHRRRGIGRKLLDTVVSHARQLRYGVLHVEIATGAEAAEGLLRSAGFSRVRTFSHMHRRLGRLSKVEVPEGCAVRLMRPDEVEAVTLLQNEAFNGSWGFCPNTVEEVRYRVFELPMGQSDDVVLLERDGALAGYCWTHQDAPGRAGVIHMMGVQPELRGQSLGLIVTGAGVDHLLLAGAFPVELTVDRQNTPARRLYRRLGFRFQRASLWYELRLD